MRFPWAGVASISQLLASPQLAERNYFTEVEYPDGGRKYKSPGAPVKMSGSPWKAGGRVPKPGEHNSDIYHREMGLSEREITALVEEGII